METKVSHNALEVAVEAAALNLDRHTRLLGEGGDLSLVGIPDERTQHTFCMCIALTLAQTLSAQLMLGVRARKIGALCEPLQVYLGRK